MIRTLMDELHQQRMAMLAAQDEMLLLQGTQISRLKAERDQYKAERDYYKGKHGRLALACTLATSDEAGYNRSVINKALENDR